MLVFLEGFRLSLGIIIVAPYIWLVLFFNEFNENNCLV